MNFVSVDDQLVNVAQIVRKAPKITLRRAYARAMREWCQQTQWLRATVPGVTEAGTKVYALGEDPNLDIVGIRAMSATQGNTVWGLEASDSSQWNPNNGPGFPRRYCYVPEGKFALDVTPDDAYVISVSLILVPKEGATQLPSDPLIKYSNDIEAGALAYLFSIPGQPWSDMQRSVLHDHEFKAGIGNGRVEVQRAFNTGSQRARPRPFLMGGF